jgi:hypothetical protein
LVEPFLRVVTFRLIHKELINAKLQKTFRGETMQNQISLNVLIVSTDVEQGWLSLMHRCKPPIIGRELPSESERFNLDDPAHWQQLGVSFKSHLPRADEYDHYPHCKWAIIECKGNSLRNSIEQLEYTARQLASFQKTVNLTIIIANKINKKEKDYFTKKGNTLYRKKDNKPILIPAGSNKIEVNIYTPLEIDKQYHEFRGTLDSLWQS